MLRDFILKFFPKLGAAMEEESRTWFICCPECGHEVSGWEAGGVRYKAAGTPRRYGRCPNCGEKTWLRLEQRKPD